MHGATKSSSISLGVETNCRASTTTTITTATEGSLLDI
jgi:hypothetical protein